MIERCWLGIRIQDPIAARVIGSGPHHFSINAAPQKLKQRGRAVGCPEETLIELCPHRRKVVRMRIPLSAHVEYRSSAKEAGNLCGPETVLMGLSHEQILHGSRVAGRIAFAVVAPFGIIMPVNKRDQGIVDFIEQPPYPVQPEGLATVHGCPSDARRTSVQPRR